MIINNRKILNALKFTGEKISSPEQRLLQGVTAMMTQPFMDLYNKDVDEETRKLSCARTTAKIIAGTSVGVAVRYATIGFVDWCCKGMDGFNHPDHNNSRTFLNKVRRCFVPSQPTMKNTIDLIKQVNLYKKAMGTILGVLVGLGTNFLLDAPLTKYLTGKFHNKIKTKGGS